MIKAKNTYCLLALLLASLSLNGCPNKSTESVQKNRTSEAPSTRIAANLGQDFQDIAQALLPAVVSISTRSKKSDAQMPDDPTHRLFNEPGEPSGGLGSGVIVDAENAYVLTNNHVIENAESIQITLQNGKHYAARVIGTDPPTDLAVLQIEKAGKLTAAILGDSSRLKVGEWVLAIGSPFGLDSTVTAGIISAKGRADVGVADFEDFIQTDAAINPGNSGGPLVSTQGELIGINTAIATRTNGYMGIGFAIPSQLAMKVMQELIAHGKVTRSQLGVYIGPVDEDLRSALKLGLQQQGILVMEVIPDTAAAEAGFQKYDLITELNGARVTEVQPFRNKIALTPPQQKVEIKIIRQGQEMLLTALLREMNSQASVLSDAETLQKQLGFDVLPLDPELSPQLGLSKDSKGLIVKDIQADSPAYQRGLRQGDLITEVNQQAVTTLSDIQTILQHLQPGDSLLLNVVRNGQSRIMAFELPK